MYIEVLKAKLTTVVTAADLEYRGSITLCPTLCKEMGIREYERVDVNNKTNGNRINTYVIYGKEGACEVNGAAAHLFNEGDVVHVNCFAQVYYDDAFEPVIIERL